MVQLPQPLRDYLYNSVVEQHFPAYLRVNGDGMILELGGCLDRYALQALEPGTDLEGRLDFLKGLLPLADEPIFLPLVKYQQGRSMDIHLLPGPEGDWILLLDGDDIEGQQLALQQQGNYLALKTKRQRQRLSQLFQGEGTASSTAAPANLKEVSVLGIRLRPKTAAVSNELVQQMETRFATVTTTIVEASGVVVAQMGDTLFAIFGVLPPPLSPAQQAMETGLTILAADTALKEPQSAAPEIPDRDVRLEAGAMVTSGTAVLGVLRGGPYETLGLMSPHMSEMMHLAGCIRPHHLIIDAATWQQLSDGQHLFTDSSSVGEDRASMTIYSRRL